MVYTQTYKNGDLDDLGDGLLLFYPHHSAATENPTVPVNDCRPQWLEAISLVIRKPGEHVHNSWGNRFCRYTHACVYIYIHVYTYIWRVTPPFFCGSPFQSVGNHFQSQLPFVLPQEGFAESIWPCFVDHQLAEDKQFKVKSMIGHWICDSIYIHVPHFHILLQIH